jgi:hypothetical protein
MGKRSVRAALAACLIAGLGATSVPTGPALAEDAPTWLGKWGSYGTGNGQFQDISGIAVGDNGRVYVGDHANPRVQYFTKLGAFQGTWGAPGNGDGQFMGGVDDLAVAPNGDVLVADGRRIQRFSATGDYKAKWGAFNCSSAFCGGLRIAVAPDGAVYVADFDNDRVQKFDADGDFLLTLGTSGSGPGIVSPRGIAVGADGVVYVADRGDRVQRFDATGAFEVQWGSLGQADGQFNDAQGIAVDGQGNVFVTDVQNSRIQKFSSTGGFLTKWGTAGSADGQFRTPRDTAFGSDQVYVADVDNARVQRFGKPSASKPAYRPDAIIQVGDGATAGDDIYNDTGLGQTRDASVRPGAHVNFNVYVQNDGTKQDSLWVKGSRQTAGFTARYYYGGTDVTNEVTSSAGYRARGISPRAFGLIRLAVTVKDDAPARAAFDTRIRVRSNGDPDAIDVVRATTVVAGHSYRPDARISTGTTMLGDDVYNTTAAGQTGTSAAMLGRPATAAISIQNDGTTADSFTVLGLRGTHAFGIEYSKGTKDITASVVSGQYQTRQLKPGQTEAIQVSIAIASRSAVGQRFKDLVTVRSMSDPKVRDAVAVVVVGQPAPYQPDARIKLASATSYAGDDIYNVTGQGQSRTGYARAQRTVRYDVSIQNDGTAADAFRVVAGGSSRGYLVGYLHGSTDVGRAVENGTYRTPDLAPGGTDVITVIVFVRAAARTDSPRSDLVLVTSVNDRSRRDAVRVITTKSG